ncbi:ABC transporter ATP-binding protein [Variovorax sp. GT1P44]|uniref:ABC transporter ATP-binding protein n=1 Tax=Variovorax sp. GT1P44 TaxID=3443742 RepID=UPI003F44EF63
MQDNNSRASLLEVRNLKVHLRVGGNVVRAVDGVDLTVGRGECVGIVGESGSGKSTLARAVLRLLPNVDMAELSGDISFNGADTLSMPDAALRKLRQHAGFSMIFQDPLGYLNPTMRVGRQIREALCPDESAGSDDARVYGLLRDVGLKDVEQVARRYPHELSGGMRQRIMIAIALASEPLLLVADEPTTALDATVQLQVLETLQRLHRERNMAMAIITHDLGVVAALCDRVYVMNGGKVVESAETVQLFERPAHPYSARLIELSRRGAKQPAAQPEGVA